MTVQRVNFTGATVEDDPANDVTRVTLGSGGGGGGGITHLLNTEGGTITYAAGPNQTLRAAFEAQDPENIHDASTGLYTVPEPGWYLLNAGINASAARGWFYFDIPRATTGLPGPSQTFGADGDYSLTALLWIDSTGTIDLEATITTGGDILVRHFGIAMLR